MTRDEKWPWKLVGELVEEKSIETCSGPCCRAVCAVSDAWIPVYTEYVLYSVKPEVLPVAERPQRVAGPRWRVEFATRR